MKRTATRLRSLALALPLLTACAGDAPAPASDGGPKLAEAGAPPALGGLAEPTAPSCPGMTTGSAAVWLDDPDDLTLVDRPLYCLVGDGALSGSFVSGVADAPPPAQSADHRFVYDLDDPRLQQVEAYYVVTAMVGHFQPLLRLGHELPAIEIELQPDEGMATSRYRYVPRKIWLGLDGIRPRLLSAQILGHEYAHHLILNHVADPDQILNEALADYLVADFTGEPSVVSLSRMDLPSAVAVDLADEARRLLERSVKNSWRYPEDAVTRGEQCAFLKRLSSKLPADKQLLTPDQLGKCDQLDEEELAALEPHLSGRIVAGALWQLRARLGSAVVNRLVFEVLAARAPLKSLEVFGPGLVAAEAATFDGEHAAAVAEVLGARGLASPPGD